MNKLRALFLCAGLLGPAISLAGVVYEWRTASASPTIYAVSGLVELSEAAVQAGSVEYVFSNPCGGVVGCDYSDPASPIVRFALMINDHPIDIDFHAGTGFMFYPEASWFHASFAIGPNGLGPVNLYAYDGQSHVRLDGAMITDANSDMPGCPVEGCSGATGGFFLVPEPATAGLFGAGLLVLAGWRRRGRARRAAWTVPRCAAATAACLDGVKAANLIKPSRPICAIMSAFVRFAHLSIHE